MLLSMAATDPAPVTLVVGDEELLADRAVGEVIAAARAADPGTEVHDLIGGKVELGELTRLTSPSLFGDSSVVVIRSAQDVVKDVAAEIISYAANPAEDTVLVLVHPGGVKGKAMVDGVRKAGARVVTVTKMTKPAERLAFVKAELKRAGRTIGGDAAGALLEAVGNDLRELAAACGQLAFDTPGKAIDGAAVARYHRGRAEVSGFTVADSAVEGRLGDALEQLRWALATGTAPVLLVSAVAGGLRSLAKVGGRPSQPAWWPARRPPRHAALEDRQSSAAAERLGPRRHRPRAPGGGQGRRAGQGRRCGSRLRAGVHDPDRCRQPYRPLARP